MQKQTVKGKNVFKDMYKRAHVQQFHWQTTFSKHPCAHILRFDPAVSYVDFLRVLLKEFRSIEPRDLYPYVVRSSSLHYTLRTSRYTHEVICTEEKY